MKLRIQKVSILVFLLSFALALQAQKNKKPNILVIWGDDIGQSNISAYTRGMMGYQTPNIDRIANEGMLFTDYYRRAKLYGRKIFFHPWPICV